MSDLKPDPSLDPSTEAARTNAVRNMGAEDGLFRSSMDVIKSSHTVGQSIRAAFVLSGVFSDKMMYAELLAQFATVTIEFETLLTESSNAGGSNNFTGLRAMYAFAPQYSSDLTNLLGPSHAIALPKLIRDPAKAYVELLRSDSQGPHAKESLLAAAIILWGPLVIGGGAVMGPRVKKAFGADCVSVFNDVTGPGRKKRQRSFIDFVDTAAASLDSEKVVELCAKYMDRNNQIMGAVQREPKWYRYAKYTVVAAVVAGVAVAVARIRK